LDSKVLRDRLYRSKASPSCLAAMGGVPPEFPFTVSDVKKARLQRAAQQTTQQNHGQQEYQSNTSSNSYSQQGYDQGSQTAATSTSATQASAPGALPAGWMAIQDPGSGRTYYANQTTGEVTWDIPQAAPAQQSSYAPAPSPAPQPAEQVQPATTSTAGNSTPSRTSEMSSKYGDGFVTSSSHPELASQYGNVGTR
jgi:protein transport protein SEC31